MDKRTFKIVSVLFAAAGVVVASSPAAAAYCQSYGDRVVCATPTHTCYSDGFGGTFCDKYNDG